MDKGGFHPLHTAVVSGEPFPGSRAAVSFLSRLVLDMASPLLSVPATGGLPRMVIPVRPTEVLTTNAYCATCLRTRRVLEPPTPHKSENSKRLDKRAPGSDAGGFAR